MIEYTPPEVHVHENVLFNGADQALRLECMKLAVANNSGHINMVIREAGEIESHIRYGRRRNESGYTPIAPECFISENASVIAFQGDNFYRGCNNFVTKNDDGGSAHCVKPVNHASSVCESFDGSTRDLAQEI